ncbi:MAG: hypothetical protein EG826_06670 [Deltaproteobacteria bacterium]|nr:hypothetical protein [Deltaproteobacteria bacterium]
MIRYMLAWMAMLIIAVANGTLRQLTFARVMSEPNAHRLSTLTGSVFIGAFIWYVIRIWPPSSGKQAWFIGLCWGFLTVAFESFMGLMLQHLTVQQVLHEYNLLEGRVWSLFLIWLVVAPWIFFRIRQARLERMEKRK